MAGNRWTAAKVIATIQRLHERGVDLSPTGIRKSHSALFSSARSKSHFGSWKAAVTAAGLDYSKIKRGKQVWSRERILRRISHAYQTHEDLLSGEFKLRHKKLYSAACAKRYFGSWKKAIEAAGIDYSALRSEHFWSRQRILRTIREIQGRGELLNWSALNSRYPSLYRAARRPENFGSWRKAVEAAGIEPAQVIINHQWTRKKIIEGIRKMAREGEDLSPRSVMRTHGPLFSAAKSPRYFGTWRAAVEAAGIEYQAKPGARGPEAQIASSSEPQRPRDEELKVEH